MNKIIKLTVLGFLLVLFFLPAHAGDAIDEEVLHLLEFVGGSDCKFMRNGSEYNSQDARRHLQRKYEYLRSGLHSAEEFINKAASRSSMSGRAYEVICGNSKFMSQQWLTRELQQHRKISAGDIANGDDT